MASNFYRHKYIKDMKVECECELRQKKKKKKEQRLLR